VRVSLSPTAKRPKLTEDSFSNEHFVVGSPTSLPSKLIDKVDHAQKVKISKLIFKIAYNLETLRYLLEGRIYPRDEKLDLMDLYRPQVDTLAGQNNPDAGNCFPVNPKTGENTNLLLAYKVCREFLDKIQAKEKKYKIKHELNSKRPSFYLTPTNEIPLYIFKNKKNFKENKLGKWRSKTMSRSQFRNSSIVDEGLADHTQEMFREKIKGNRVQDLDQNSDGFKHGMRMFFDLLKDKETAKPNQSVRL